MKVKFERIVLFYPTFDALADSEFNLVWNHSSDHIKVPDNKYTDTIYKSAYEAIKRSEKALNDDAKIKLASIVKAHAKDIGFTDVYIYKSKISMEDNKIFIKVYAIVPEDFLHGRVKLENTEL